MPKGGYSHKWIIKQRTLKCVNKSYILMIYQHIRIISEGESCDTEDWSNDAENLAVPSQEYIIF